MTASRKRRRSEMPGGSQTPTKRTELGSWSEAAAEKPDPFAVLNTAEAIAKSLRQRVLRGDHLAHVELLRLQAEDGNGEALWRLINHAAAASAALLGLWESHDCFTMSPDRHKNDEGRKKKERRRHNLRELAKVRDDWPVLRSWKEHDQGRWEVLLKDLPLAENSIWKTKTMKQSLTNMAIVTVFVPVLERRRRQLSVVDRETLARGSTPTISPRCEPLFRKVGWLAFDRMLAVLPPLSRSTGGRWARMMAEMLALTDEEGGTIAVPAGHFPPPDIFRAGIVIRRERMHPRLMQLRAGRDGLSGLILGPQPTMGRLIPKMDREAGKQAPRKKERVARYEAMIQAAADAADDPIRIKHLDMRKRSQQECIDQLPRSRGKRISSWQQFFAERLKSMLKSGPED
jgi:hypothetical protein